MGTKCGNMTTDLGIYRDTVSTANTLIIMKKGNLIEKQQICLDANSAASRSKFLHFKSVLTILALCLCMVMGGEAWGQTTLLSENFDNMNSISTSYSANGWYAYNAGNGNNWVLNTNSTYSCSGSNSAEYEYNSSNAANCYLVSAPFTVSANMTQLNVSLYEMVDPDYAETFEVFFVKASDFSTAAGVVSATHYSAIASASYTNEYCEQVTGSNVNSALAGQSVRVVIHCTSARDRDYLEIDDITVTETTSGGGGGCPSITFSDLYSSNTNVNGTSITIASGISVIFNKAGGNNNPQYNTNGSAIRAYYKNTFTVTSSVGNITSINLSFGTGGNNNTITASSGTYDNGSWTGSATSVTFTIGGTSGNRRIAGIEVCVSAPSVTCPVYLVWERVNSSSNWKGSVTYSYTDGNGVVQSGTGTSNGNTTINVKTGTTITLTATRTGNGTYRITAKKDDASGEQIAQASQAGSNGTNTDTQTVDCSAAPITYTVTYNSNGGTGTMTDSDSPYPNNATVTTLANTFTRTGYAFTGWNTAANGTGTSYAEGATFTITANTTLYAQWAEVECPYLKFSSLGYSNEQNVPVTAINVPPTATVSFALGSGSNAPKYYNNGASIRAYNGNTITVAATGSNVVTSVRIIFACQESNNNTISANAGTYSNGSWSGSESSVTFTIGGSNGHRRILGIEVCTEAGGSSCPQIGTGTNTTYTYGPVNNYYNYSYRQIIYPASSLVGGAVNSIAFYYDYSSPMSSKTDVDIYMGTTSASAFAFSTSWIPVSSLTLVYSGPLNCTSSGWNTFNLTTPFYYNGTENLVLAINDKSGTYNGQYYVFRYSESASNVQLYEYDDGSAYDPASPGSGTQTAYYPNTKFCIEACDNSRTGTLSFAVTSFDVVVGDSFTEPTLNNTLSPRGTVTYRSSNTSVATVNSSTGDVSLTGAEGTTEIIATDENGDYCPVLASYTINVTDGCTRVGNGTTTVSNAPLYAYYNNSYVQMLYLSDEIDNSGAINSIAFNAQSANSETRTIKIYMKNTTRTSFSSSTDYETVTAADVVYEGTWNIVAGWNTFTLPTPFNYDGSNLFVAMLSEANDYESTSFYGTSLPGLVTYAYNDTYVPDPYDMSSYLGTESTTDSRPNAKICIDGCTRRTGTLTFSGSSFNAETGAPFTKPTLTNTLTPAGTPVFTSSNTSIATVNSSTGDVTIGNTTGTVTITATVPLETISGVEYCRVSTSYNIVVTPPVATVPYSYGFENVGDNNGYWMFGNGTQVNKWTIGQAVDNGGDNSLYVSMDNGLTHEYNENSTSYVYAYRLMNFTVTGTYQVSFDWISNGESNYDYLRVFLVPAAVAPEFAAGEANGISYGNTPTGWISIDGGSQLIEQDIWQSQSLDNLNISSAGLYYLVFYWRNDGSLGDQPPAAIDNIVIMPPCDYTLDAPTNLSVSNITTSGATLSWTGDSRSEGYYVTVNGTTQYTTSSTLTVSNLAAGTLCSWAIKAVGGANVCESPTVYPENFSILHYDGDYAIARPYGTQLYALNGISGIRGTSTVNIYEYLDAGEIVSNTVTEPARVTIVQVSDEKHSLYLNGVGYLGWTSDNSLTYRANAPIASDVNYLWQLTTGADRVTIANMADLERKLQYRSSEFACYTSTQSFVNLYPFKPCTPAGISFSTTMVDAILGQDVDEPSLSNHNGLAITYASSNTSVATVNATTGEVTTVGYGRTVISATATEQGEYCAGFVTYTLIVSDGCPEVGTGNSTIATSPINTGYTKSYTQMLFTSDEVEARNITKLSFNASGTAETFDRNISIYMGMTDKNVFSTSRDFVATSELTLVYSGTKRLASGWNDFELNTPYEYTDLTKNLVVAVYSTASSTSTLKFYYTSAGSDKVCRAWYGTTDPNPASISDWSTFPAAYAEKSGGRPNTKFCYGGCEPSYLSYSRDYATLVIGCADTRPIELNNPNGLAVTYTSSNTSVATVAADGTLHVVGIGITTITAMADVQTIGGIEYCKGTDYYVLTVAPAAANVPYSYGFENTGDDVNAAWQFANGTSTNRWCIGTDNNPDASYEGTHGLYITNDGTEYNYTQTSAAAVYAYRKFNFEYTGSYNVQFRWKSNGQSTYDYLRAFLVDASINPRLEARYDNGITSDNYPSGWIPVDGVTQLQGQSSWQLSDHNVYISQEGEYYLIFYWVNNNTSGSNPPAAIDNVVITPPCAAWFENAFPTVVYSSGGTYTQTVQTANITGTPTITYASSNTSVATVNASTGVVSLVGAGETVISVVVQGDCRVTARYTLSVLCANLGRTIFTDVPIADDGIYYYDACLGNDVEFNLETESDGHGGIHDWYYRLNPHRGQEVVENTVATADRTRQYTYPVNAAAGYDVVVKVTRNDGCVSTANARIRVSGGLTSAVSSYDAGDICIGRTDVITVGGSVGGEPSVITVEPEPFSIVANAGQGVRTFIPDGFACETRCYTSSATFNDFVDGSKVTSGEDIVYLKINMEHTFIGDMQIKLKCPEDENHVVREMIILQDYLDTDSHNENPLDPSVYDNGLDDDSYTWPYRDPSTNKLLKLYFGEPNTSDGTGSSICTESSNPAGVGYDYCWTNTATTYVYEAQNHEEAGSYHRVKASNMNGLIQTYKPWQPFDNLIGCPLNGTWEISVCDGFALDNGYVFNWELSLKKEFTPAPWNYVVYVDSLRVTVPPADQSFVTVDASTLSITPDFDAALGSHNANLFIVDNFGCNVNNGASMPITYNIVNTVNTVFNISADENICLGAETTLSASSGFARYDWSNGANTRSITDSPQVSPATYSVTVTDRDGCKASAQRQINVNTPRTANFADIQTGDFVWRGVTASGVNTADWNTPSNWYTKTDGGYSVASGNPLTLPTTDNNVYIQEDNCTDVSNMPVLSANAGAKNLTIGESKSLALGGHSLDIAGNLINTGTFNATNGTVVFCGPSSNGGDQTISNNITLGNVTFNNQGGNIVPNGSMTINGAATFTKGIVKKDLVTFGNNASATANTYESYVDGTVTKSGSANGFTFPTGSNGVLGKVAATSDVSGVSVQYFNNPDGFGLDVYPRWWNINDMCSGNTPQFDHVSNFEYWDIATTASLSATLTVSSADSVAHFNSVSPTHDGGDVYGAFWNGSCWENIGGVDHHSVSANPYGTITVDVSIPATRAYSKIVSLGSQDHSTVLPIELTALTATCDGRSSLIEWTTATEKNNDYFSLERSDDAVNFVEVARVAGAGNSIEPIDYAYTDYGIHGGDNYYRLVQVDYDGTRTVSEIVVANCIEPEPVQR